MYIIFSALNIAWYTRNSLAKHQGFKICSLYLFIIWLQSTVLSSKALTQPVLSLYCRRALKWPLTQAGKNCWMKYYVNCRHYLTTLTRTMFLYVVIDIIVWTKPQRPLFRFQAPEGGCVGPIMHTKCFFRNNVYQT